MVIDLTLLVLRQPACEPVVPGAKALEKNKLLAWLERFSGSSKFGLSVFPDQACDRNRNIAD